MMVVFPSASWETDAFPIGSMVWRVNGSTVTWWRMGAEYINMQFQKLAKSNTIFYPIHIYKMPYYSTVLLNSRCVRRCWLIFYHSIISDSTVGSKENHSHFKCHFYSNSVHKDFFYIRSIRLFFKNVQLLRFFERIFKRRFQCLSSTFWYVKLFRMDSFAQSNMISCILVLWLSKEKKIKTCATLNTRTCFLSIVW